MLLTLIPMVTVSPCILRGRIPLHAVGSLSENSLSLVFHLLVPPWDGIHLPGRAGEAQRRTSLSLWLEGPKQADVATRPALRTVGRSKAVGVQVRWGLACGRWADTWLRRATQGPFGWEGRKEALVEVAVR